MYHSFFIHSSVDEHLGCVYVLAIVNSVAIYIGGTYVFLNVVFFYILVSSKFWYFLY